MVGDKISNDTNPSVANRVIAEFVAAIAEDEALSDIAPRLKAALFDTDNLKEEVLRKALFGEGDA